jgi:hypothetical protein
MAENKMIYAIALAVAVFAGLSMVAVSNIFVQQGNISTSDTYGPEAFAQSVIGIRQNIITVSGSAFKDVEPDEIVVSFGVETQALTADQASALNAETMNKVVDAVKNVGIEEDEISTSRFNVYPNYDSTGRVITGYTVSNIVTVKTTKLEKASDIIDSTVEAGANRVENVFFTLSDTMQKQLRDELIADAIEDAQGRAEKALKPLNKNIIGVKSISLSDFGIPGPIPVFERAAFKAAAEPTPIFKSEQQVSMSATIIFLID